MRGTAIFPLTLRVGYDKAAKVAQAALAQNRTIREVVIAEGILSVKEADALLDPREMLGPKEQMEWAA